MPRLNKTASKNLFLSIQRKATKLFTATPNPRITMKDYDAIIKICERGINRLK